MNQLSPQQWRLQNGTTGTSLGLTELLWYQRYTKVLDLTPQMAIQSKLAGTYLAKSKGRGMEFDEVRHYQNGDDVRTIDWRVTARTGKVHTKLFREEKERPVFILTDLSSSMHFGSSLLFKSVQAAHLADVVAGVLGAGRLQYFMAGAIAVIDLETIRCHGADDLRFYINDGDLRAMSDRCPANNLPYPA